MWLILLEMHLKSPSSESKWFFYRKICQNLLVEKYQLQYQVFLYQGMVYIFEMCHIVFKKRKRPKVGKLSLKTV
jgi:hypothetical protein